MGHTGELAEPGSSLSATVLGEPILVTRAEDGTVSVMSAVCRHRGHTLGAKGALSIAPVLGWERYRTAQAWGRPFVMPSPNMPSLETALVYPGACLVEGERRHLRAHDVQRERRDLLLLDQDHFLALV